MQPEHGCAITGWASALPSTVVTNQDIMTLFDTTDEWIVERTGIRERRAADGPFVHPRPPASPPEGMGTTGLLAAEAGRSAMRVAGVTGANFVVSRILFSAAGIAAGDGLDAREHLENRFGAPKAAAAQRGGLSVIS